MRSPNHSALVVGLGRFGRAAAITLRQLGWDVAGIDKDPEVIRELRMRMEHLIELDASDEEALRSINVPDFEVCIVSGGNSIESSVLLVLNLQQLGARNIVAKAASDHHARILRRLEVDEIVFPERDAGRRLAESLHVPHIAQYLPIGEHRHLAILRVPEEAVGTELGAWKVLSRPTLQILARLDWEGVPLSLDSEARLKSEETLVVVGSPADIQAMRQ